MKTLVLYESKNGYTKKCSRYLYEKLENCDIFDIFSKDYIINNYDKIFIGAPIYVGEIAKLTKNFIKTYKNLLLKKDLGLFFAGMSKKDFNLAVQNSLPPEIFYHAEIVHCGGVVDFTRLNWKDKRTIKKRLHISSSIKDEMLFELDELLK